MANDKALYCNISGVTNVQSVTIEESYSQISASATIDCESTTLDLSDSVSIDLGYSDNHATVFSGYIKQKKYNRPDGIVTLVANDVLVRAVDYFMASDDPENPFQVENTPSFDLVKQLLAIVNLTNVVGTEPNFTFGTNGAAKFNLQSISDAVQFIAQVTGYTIYASDDGQIHFVARKPYPVGGDTSLGTLTTGDGKQIIDITYEKSSIPIRDRVVVYGKGTLHATAESASPYTVVRQTATIAHELLDTQAICDATASVNLALLNRLGETYTVTLEGDPAYRARSIWTLDESFTSTSNRKVFMYRSNHTFTNAGYIVQGTFIP